MSTISVQRRHIFTVRTDKSSIAQPVAALEGPRFPHPVPGTNSRYEGTAIEETPINILNRIAELEKTLGRQLMDAKTELSKNRHLVEDHAEDISFLERWFQERERHRLGVFTKPPGALSGEEERGVCLMTGRNLVPYLDEKKTLLEHICQSQKVSHRDLEQIVEVLNNCVRGGWFEGQHSCVHKQAGIIIDLRIDLGLLRELCEKLQEDICRSHQIGVRYSSILEKVGAAGMTGVVCMDMGGSGVSSEKG